MSYELKKAIETLVKGRLEFMILEVLSMEPCYGYKLIKTFRKLSYLGPSTIYPLLNDMEKRGLLTSGWKVENGRPRKIYSLSPKGVDTLKKYIIADRFIRSELNRQVAKQFQVILPEEVKIKNK